METTLVEAQRLSVFHASFQSPGQPNWFVNKNGHEPGRIFSGQHAEVK